VEFSLTLPVFVKPARAGSSIGITKVKQWDELAAAIDEARLHDPKVVVEQGIEGAEIECGVLGGGRDQRARASVCAEISLVDGREFYDFEAKYLDDAAVLTVPADLPAEVAARVADLAVRAFEALECEGLARVDFFVAPGGTILVNEVNTMPGFTPSSMYPRMWQASGVDYPELIDRLLELALTRETGLR
jgi:D-alanine-D-alanine ligase